MRLSSRPTGPRRLLLALALLLTAAAARAQMSTDLIMETGNANMSAITSAAISNANLNNILDGSARPNSKQGIVVGRPGSSASRSPGAAAGAGLPYAVTPALKQQTVQGYITRLKSKNPAASQAVATAFGTGKYDYGTIYRGLIDGYGMRENNAVDATAAYLVLGWMIVNNVQNDKAVSAAMVQGARAQLAPRLLASPKLAASGAAAQVGEEMKLLSVVVQGGWQSAIREKTLPAYRQGIAALFKNQYGLDLSQLRLTPQGFAGKTATGTTTMPPANGAGPTPPAVASGSGSAAGAQWFFRAVSSGSGGVAFEPVVLLTSGKYFDIGDEPLEGLNVAAAQAARPAAWGSWRKSGSAFVLTNYKGQPHSYTLGSGNWFPAYAAGAVPLKRSYENASGGSVGTATSLVISKIQFLDGTHFQEGQNAGIVAANAAGGSKRGGSGTYRLQAHTLTLTYATGRTVRKSFAWGPRATPPTRSTR